MAKRARQIGCIAVAALCALCTAAASPAARAQDEARSRACGQHSVVNGIHHQPTTADIEAAQTLCGITSPVDTAPEFGAMIDEINSTLLGALRD
jgi:hypothetical protein